MSYFANFFFFVQNLTIAFIMALTVPVDILLKNNIGNILLNEYYPTGFPFTPYYMYYVYTLYIAHLKHIVQFRKFS